MVKFLLYLLVLPLVIYAIDSINFTNIFKKNKITFLLISIGNMI